MGGTPDGLHDPREPVREVCAMPRPERHPLAFLAGQDAEAVMLDLVRPAQS